MNIVFRADASLTIGTGHVSRCLTLAESLKRRGAHITFICATGSHAFVPRLTEVADAIIELPHLAAEVEGSSDDTWLTVPSTIDAKATIAALDGRPVDWLVVDHYGIDANWESQLRPFVDQVMVIDDLANRKHDCDLLLDQNLPSTRVTNYRELIPDHARICQGPQFALLRQEFSAERQSGVRIRSNIKRILISFGGVDSANGTEVALNALTNNHPKIEVHVAIGQSHPERQGITRRCIEAGYTCHIQTQQMARLVAMADLAIGAGGASAWERCFLGLPSIILITAANQNDIASALAQARGAINLGPLTASSSESITTTLHELIENPSRVRTMSRAALRLMHGHRDVAELIHP